MTEWLRIPKSWRAALRQVRAPKKSGFRDTGVVVDTSCNNT